MLGNTTFISRVEHDISLVRVYYIKDSLFKQNISKIKLLNFEWFI